LNDLWDFSSRYLTNLVKKTGKAIGNKLYGAYADDKRIGINRGKLKGESDGLKISKSYLKEDAEEEERTLQFETETRMHGEIEREIGKQEEMRDVINIKLDPSKPKNLVESLAKLSSYVDLHIATATPDDYCKAAKSKFEMGLAMLQAVNPENPMISYYLKKQKEWKNKRTLIYIGISICIAVLIGIMVWAINEVQNQETPNINDIIGKFRRS